MSSDSAVYYDPYKVEIATDPYPVFRRLREEAPLYHNEEYDFYAVSQFEDRQRHSIFPNSIRTVFQYPQSWVENRYE